MKKVSKIWLMLPALAILVASCGPKSQIEGYDVTKSGLHYKFTTKNNGGQQVKVGDVLLGDLVLYLDETALDSVVGQSVPLFEVAATSTFPGDINEGLLKMRVGDEAIFAVNADSLNKYGMHMPSGYMNGENQTIRYKFKLTEIKTKDEMRKEFESEMESRKNAEKASLEAYIAENDIKAQPTADGLYIIPIKKGKGATITDGNEVVVNYTGRLLDGKIFDTSDKSEDPEAHEPFTYKVGQQSVIRGWDIAIRTMCQGDKVRIIVPSDLAYGPGDGRAIPPYSTLIFDMEVLSVK